MGIIHKLDEQLSNMIAAGEVVERPSAVVKELVENALDAHAHWIEVRFSEGGILSIDVSDDGEGMVAEDATEAFERHATSKILTKEDLFAPRNLGFRGEALPSIASVSQVNLDTSKNNVGTHVSIHYGKIIKVRPTSCPQGTKIHVEGLFRKTPARLKHLKSVSYEASLIVDLMQKFALSRPDIAFSVKDENKTLLSTLGNSKLIDVYAATYGNRLAQQAHLFSFEDYDFKVEGLWVEPQETRFNQKDILIFINGRMIRTWHLQKAVTEAFEAYIPAHRYPLALLHIHVDAQLVDVNVHPSKWEVRLSKEQQLYYLIVDGLAKVLHEQVGAKPSRTLESFTSTSQEVLFDVEHYPTLELQVNESISTYRHPTFPHLDLIGQMHGRYILASSAQDLYMIDQHAAKERVNYEKILKQLKQTDAYMDLLMPEVIETNLSFMEVFEDYNQALKNLGIEAEAFSINSYLIRRIPLWLKEVDLTTFNSDLMERYLASKKLDQANLQETVIATMACHKSVRFNQNLTETDMRQILSELATCEQPYQCPHGRPTLIKIQGEAIWKDFDR